MKKGIALFLIVCAFAGITAHAQEEPGWTLLEQEVKRHLINLINIDTSQPNPQEVEAVRYIYKELNKHHIDWDIFRPDKKHANLLARIRGSDATQKPLLLISHLDTSPAAEGWTFPPFRATEKDGNIYGLGATDAKNYTAVYLALLIWLKEQNITPKRDIIFLATSGEEVGSITGLQWLKDTHWEQINAGFALNEGGGVIYTEDFPLVFAEAATKMYMDIKVTAYGTGVHSSMPLNDNAVYALSQVLAKISEYKPKARVTAPARTFFSSILPLQDEDGKTTIRFLLEGTPQNQQSAAQVLSADPFFRTQLQDTLNPTVLSASQDAGATSGEASALINVRLLPGSDPDALLVQLQSLFTEQDNVVLEIVERPQLPSAPMMDGSDILFSAITKTASKLWPGAVTVPGLNPASGDNEFLRKLGVITYGLGLEMSPDGENRSHEANEFISQTDLQHQLRFIAGIVFDFAYGKELLPLTENTGKNKDVPAK